MLNEEQDIEDTDGEWRVTTLYEKMRSKRKMEVNTLFLCRHLWKQSYRCWERGGEGRWFGECFSMLLPRVFVLSNPGWSLQFNECQDSCGKGKIFHHACNVQWLENKGVDAELRKLCISFVLMEYYYAACSFSCCYNLIINVVVWSGILFEGK